MKKNLFYGLMLAIACMTTMSSCNSCSKSEKVYNPETEQVMSLYHDYDGVAQDFTAGVSHIQALHRQTMYSPLGVQEYEWRNSKVIYSDSITLESIDNLQVVAVNDAFYYWNDEGPWVQYVNSHVLNGVQIPWPINTVWIEDDDLSEVQIKLSAEDALQRLKEVNCPIPPTMSITLRLPVGPYDCNAQWVIGDIYDVLFIDAVTGEVRNWCPAFNPNNNSEKGNIATPLGELPEL
ncbi:MAG: hypothetical protein IJ557_02680 [Bacteroidaceae bacterium]|nr:hypothetical protein [Bacteroidaceae bacterium]